MLFSVATVSETHCGHINLFDRRSADLPECNSKLVHMLVRKRAIMTAAPQVLPAVAAVFRQNLPVLNIERDLHAQVLIDQHQT